MESQNKSSAFVRRALTNYFKKRIGNRKFCIISNDCWGAELYKLLDRPFNTPFIGLMIMSPCYIKLLQNPQYYLNEPLNFKSESRYPEMQQIKSGINFPLATLGDSDIEVHFMHYLSADEAKSKWSRRCKRMDWGNLFIKYDCGKDYASTKDIETFIRMNYGNKLLIGKERPGNIELFIIKEYNLNGRKQFKNCFLHFDPIGWLKGKPDYSNLLRKKIGQLAYRYL
jgi:uncharacterized protein (DUF1919 family)